MEIELKLLVDPHRVRSLRQHPLLAPHADTEAREYELADTYFDTSDQRLRRAGAGLRVRSVDGSLIQTFKGGGDAGGGLHRRHEWETPVAGAVPELERLRPLVRHPPAWRRLLDDPQFGAGLAPIFRTVVKRSTWTLRLVDGTTVEAALDIGSIESGARSEPICELELELKSGEAARLFDLALELERDVPLRVAAESKLERGFRLLDAAAPGAVSVALPALEPRMKPRAGLQRIAAACLQQMQANEEGVAAGDAESVHQMRVGLRRLRAALEVFGAESALPPSLAGELEWLDGKLAAARDREVLAGATLALPAASDAAPREFAMLEQAALAAAADRHAAAAAALGSPRYNRLLLECGRWLLAPAIDNPARDLAELAAAALRRTRKRLRKRGRRIAEADAAGRHRVRIAARKARYAAEFFRSLYPGRRMQRHIAALAALQDELGWQNDIAVGVRLLQEAAQAQPGLAAAVAFACGYLDALAAGRDAALRKRWKRYRKAPRPKLSGR